MQALRFIRWVKAHFGEKEAPERGSLLRTGLGTSRLMVWLRKVLKRTVTFSMNVDRRKASWNLPIGARSICWRPMLGILVSPGPNRL